MSKSNLSNLLIKIGKRDIPVENRKAILEHDREIKANGLADNTRITYLIILDNFALSVKKPFKDISKDEIMTYLNNLSLDFKASSVNLYGVCLKRFYKWLNGNEEYPTNIKWLKTTDKNKNKNGKLPEELLTIVEIKKMAQVANNPRDKAIVMVLYESACRVSELVNLKLKHITFDNYGAKLLVKGGKTGDRVIRVMTSAQELALWLNYHNDRENPEAPLFINISNKDYGKRLDVRGVWFLLKDLAKLAGIKKRVYPHLLRHTRLTELAKLGFTEAELRVFAGWSGGSKTPEIYIHLSSRDIDDKLLAVHGKIALKDVDKELLKPQVCYRCNEENPISLSFCKKCHYPLSIKGMEKVEAWKKLIHEEIERRLALADITLNAP